MYYSQLQNPLKRSETNSIAKPISIRSIQLQKSNMRIHMQKIIQLQNLSPSSPSSTTKPIQTHHHLGLGLEPDYHSDVHFTPLWIFLKKRRKKRKWKRKGERRKRRGRITHLIETHPCKTRCPSLQTRNSSHLIPVRIPAESSIFHPCATHLPSLPSHPLRSWTTRWRPACRSLWALQLRVIVLAVSSRFPSFGVPLIAFPISISLFSLTVMSGLGLFEDCHGCVRRGGVERERAPFSLFFT